MANAQRSLLPPRAANRCNQWPRKRADHDGLEGSVLKSDSFLLTMAPFASIFPSTKWDLPLGYSCFAS